MKNLIADDDLLSRRMLAGFWPIGGTKSSSPLEVIVATNGTEAWRLPQEKPTIMTT